MHLKRTFDKQIEIQKLLETNLQTLENRCELLELQNDQIRHEKEKLQNMLNAKVRSQQTDHLVLDVMGVGEVSLPVSSSDSNLYSKDQQVQLSFRPHAVKVDPVPTTSDASSLCIQGTVETSEFMGESTRYRVRVGERSLSVDQAHYAGLSKLTVGSPLRLSVSTSQIRLFHA